jgi:hypothetical protein
MLGGIVETSASFEARSAPRSYPTINRRTVERWRTWWRDSFTTTPFWKVARAAFMPPVDPGLPAARGRVLLSVRSRVTCWRRRTGRH